MIQLIAERIDGTRVQLDVDQREVIAMKMSFISLTDIEKQTGNYTRQFSLPRSENNDVYFGQFGDPAAIGNDWNTQFEAPVWLLDNSDLIIEGSLRMERSDPRHNRYNVSISGDVFTIKEAIGDALMSDLDMSAWTFVPSQIATTWGRTIFGGHVVFPIHDFGFGYGLYKKAGVANSLFDISNSATPIVLDNCIPAFRLNELIRKIFNEKGLTVQGSWFSESEVEEIYVQANNPLSSFVQLVSTLQTRITSTFTLPSTAQVIPFRANPANPAWSDTLFEYTAPQNGTYFWDMTLSPTGCVPAGNIVLAQFQVNGINTGAPYPTPCGTQLVLTNVSFVLTAGDKLRVTIFQVPPFTTAGFLFAYGSNFLNLVNVVLSGIATDPSAYWSNIKQFEFLQAYLQIFNLVIYQDKEKKVNIDTWESYMTGGTTRDWRDKVDESSVPVVSPINGQLRNPINLELQRVRDVLNKEYIDVVGRSYGSYREDTNIPFTQSAKGQYPLFSPGPVQEILSTVPSAAFPDVLISKFYQSEDNLEYEAPGLIFYYYNELKPAGKTYYTVDAAGGVATARTDFPYFSNFRLFSASGWQVLQNTLDLNFTYFTPPSPGIVSVPSDQGLYNRYFREMLRERYDIANKIVEFRVVLDSLDISNFRFSDTVLINLKGTPVGLKILNIDDYQVGRKTSVRVRGYITFIQ
jgi:hypothetical protein